MLKTTMDMAKGVMQKLAAQDCGKKLCEPETNERMPKENLWRRGLKKKASDVASQVLSKLAAPAPTSSSHAAGPMIQEIAPKSERAGMYAAQGYDNGLMAALNNSLAMKPVEEPAKSVAELAKPIAQQGTPRKWWGEGAHTLASQIAAAGGNKKRLEAIARWNHLDVNDPRLQGGAPKTPKTPQTPQTPQAPVTQAVSSAQYSPEVQTTLGIASRMQSNPSKPAGIDVLPDQATQKPAAPILRSRGVPIVRQEDMDAASAQRDRVISNSRAIASNRAQELSRENALSNPFRPKPSASAKAGFRNWLDGVLGVDRSAPRMDTSGFREWASDGRTYR